MKRDTKQINKYGTKYIEYVCGSMKVSRSLLRSSSLSAAKLARAADRTGLDSLFRREEYCIVSYRGLYYGGIMMLKRIFGMPRWIWSVRKRKLVEIETESRSRYFRHEMLVLNSV
jgi:hypothetical protein